MSSMLVRRPLVQETGQIVSIAPDGDAWHYVHFRVAALSRGRALADVTGENETVLVFISGTADVASSRATWKRVGVRPTPFDGPPQAIYLPPNTEYEVRAETAVEIAVCAAAAPSGSFDARKIVLTDADAKLRGTGQAQRRIFDILMDPAACEALFITEVLTPPGNWSSYPPHKHDTNNPPVESALEEIYYYRIQPQSGFAFQRVYTADGDLDETITAFDRDAVLVPRGYHVCAAAAEYSVYYLNVLAGPKHVYHMTFDPAHEWIKEHWTW